MSQTDMLRTVEEVMAALDDERPVERLTKGGAWRPVPISTSKSVIIYLLSVGYQFRIASPSRQAMGSQVVSDDDGFINDLRWLIAYTNPHPIREFIVSRLVDRGWLTDEHSKPCELTDEGNRLVSAALAASALLARRPCAQGRGDEAMLSWSGFNVHGDAASIAEVKRTVHNCGQFDAGFRHPAPPSAPASTHAAWPTRDWCDLTDADFAQIRVDMPNVTAGITETKLRMIGSWFVERLTAAGGRDGEGS